MIILGEKKNRQGKGHKLGYTEDDVVGISGQTSPSWEPHNREEGRPHTWRQEIKGVMVHGSLTASGLSQEISHIPGILESIRLLMALFIP